MRFYVGVTDGDWFKFLRELNPPPEDIDFWQPSSRQPAILKRGEPFLFKLHAPYNKIAGLGFSQRSQSCRSVQFGKHFENEMEQPVCTSLRKRSHTIKVYITVSILSP